MCSAHVVTRGRAGENEAREASRVQSGMGGLGKMEGRGQSWESQGMDRTGVPSTAPPRTVFLSRDRTAPSCWAHLTLTGSFQLESNLPPEASPDSSFHALGNTDKFWSPHLASQLPRPGFQGPHCTQHVPPLGNWVPGPS